MSTGHLQSSPGLYLGWVKYRAGVEFMIVSNAVADDNYCDNQNGDDGNGDEDDDVAHNDKGNC